MLANREDKLLFFAMVACLALLLLSGIVIWRQYFLFYFPIGALRLASVIHAAAAFVLIAGIVVHQGLDTGDGARHRHARLGAQAPPEMVPGKREVSAPRSPGRDAGRGGLEQSIALIRRRLFFERHMCDSTYSRTE